MRRLISGIICSICFNSFAQDTTDRIYELPEIIYIADAVTVSNDTLTYNVSRITTLADKNVEDLLRKLPGVDIDASGAIRYNDKPISHFYIEGIDLLGGGYTLATRHIRPEDLLSIQVLENHQPIKVMKGRIFSERAAINIKLKKSRLARPIGYVQTGSGIVGSATANTTTHLMKIGNSLQQLFHIGSQFDSFVQAENNVTNVGSEMSLSSDLDNSLFSTDLFNTPSFSKRRYMGNRDAEASYNLARKVSDSYQYKLNAAYSAVRNSFTQEMNSKLLSGDEVIDRKESNHAVYHTQKAKVNIETEKNSESLYMKHISSLRFDRQSNDYSVQTSYNGQINESLTTPKFDYRNSTSLAIPIKEHRLQANISMSLTNRPHNEMCYYVNEDSGAIGEYLQTFEGTSFSVKGNTAHQYSFNSSYNIGAALKADYSYNDLVSEYSHEKSLMSRNDLRSSIFLGTLTPFFKINYTRETFTLEFPIEWRVADFEKAGNKHFNYNKADFNIQIINTFRFNRLLYVEAELKRDKNYGSSLDFFSEPFRTSYIQTTRRGNDEWSMRTNISANMSLYYRNAIEGTNLTLSTMYRESESGTLTDYTIGHANDANTVVYGKNKQKMADASMIASKQFYDYFFGIKLLSNIGYSNRTYIRSSVPYDLSAIYSTIRLSLDKTMLSRKLNLQITSGVDQSKSDIKMKSGQTTTDIRNTSWSIDSKASYSPVKSWTTFISCNAQWNKRDVWEKDIYLEGGIMYSHSKHEFNLALTNLMNERTWYINSISMVDTKLYAIDLLPIGFNLTYKYSF